MSTKLWEECFVASNGYSGKIAQNRKQCLWKHLYLLIVCGTKWLRLSASLSPLWKSWGWWIERNLQWDIFMRAWIGPKRPSRLSIREMNLNISLYGKLLIPGGTDNYIHHCMQQEHIPIWAYSIMRSLAFKEIPRWWEVSWYALRRCSRIKIFRTKSTYNEICTRKHLACLDSAQANVSRTRKCLVSANC